MRFFWKATPESRDHQGIKCKIMRAVTFPETMDMYELSTENLQTKLKANRERADKAFEDQLAAKRAKLDEGSSSSSSASSSATAPMETVEQTAGPAIDEDDDEAAALQAALQMSMGKVEDVPVSEEGEFIGQGLPANFTGLYELHGIVTHKGRDADSGHYIGWVRQRPGSDYWWCYDDDKVTEVTTADVMLLKGGGDRDTAYLNFYRYKDEIKNKK